MPRYAYAGRSNGQPVSGVLEGSDPAAVASELQSRGIAPLRITPSGKAGGESASSAPSRTAGGPAWAQPKVTPVDVMLLSRQLHTLLRAGVPILRALNGLQDSCTNPTLRRVLGEVRQSLESGMELSVCLAQHGKIFDGFYIAMIRVGEMTGRLDDVLRRLADHLDFEIFMGQQVKSALRYPLFVISAMAVAVAVINLMVIPAFEGVFAAFNAQLPLPTRLLIATSHFTLQWGWAIALGLVVAFVVWQRWKRSDAGRPQWDALTLRLPLAGKIVRKATLSRFARSFSLAMRSGLPIEQTLTITASTVGNAHISIKVDAMREAVERGETILRAATAANVFTPVVLQMIAVGEETGQLDALMDEVAQLYNGEVQYELKTLSQQIEPILVVFLGLMVLVLALGVFLPMWDLGKVAIKN